MTEEPYDPEEYGSADFKKMSIQLDTGEVVPITNLVNGNDEVADPVDASHLVAGPTSTGNWLVFPVEDDDLREAGLIK